MENTNQPKRELTPLEKREQMFERMGRNSWELEMLMRDWRKYQKEKEIKDKEQKEKEEYEKKFKTFNLFKEEKNGTDNTNI